jgi:hypothetical protein
MAAQYGAATSVLDWNERLVCSKCGGRAVNFVLTGRGGVRRIMRDGLLDAQASVDWAVERLPDLEVRVYEWLRLNVVVEVKDLGASNPNNIFVAVQRQELPRSFNVEIGAYLNVIRSSLDILASVLAGRYGICAPKDAYFPITESEAVFLTPGSRRARFVAGLPSAERSRLEALKPYRGGNDDLWSLHQLDIMRKHRRLVTVIAEPDLFAVQGIGVHQHFHPVATGFMRADNVSEREVVLGMMAKEAPPYGINFAPYVGFDESTITGRKHVVVALRDFARLAISIIQLFDA